MPVHVYLQIECDLTTELEQLSQDVHFKDLTTKHEHHPPPLLCNDHLNRIVGHSNLDLNDRQRGYSWDDNDEGSSYDDSSSEENNSCVGEQFESKWEELSNSVTTLSPLKQLPLVKSSSLSSQAITSSSLSSKKHQEPLQLLNLHQELLHVILQ